MGISELLSAVESHLGDVMGWVDKIIDIAQKLGNLPSAAVFALVAIGLVYKDYSRTKEEHLESLKRLEAWQDASKANEHQTTAMEKTSDMVAMSAQAVQQLVREVSVLSALIKDRQGRGGL